MAALAIVELIEDESGDVSGCRAAVGFHRMLTHADDVSLDCVAKR